MHGVVEALSDQPVAIVCMPRKFCTLQIVIITKALQCCHSFHSLQWPVCVLHHATPVHTRVRPASYRMYNPSWALARIPTAILAVMCCQDLLLLAAFIMAEA